MSLENRWLEVVKKAEQYKEWYLSLPPEEKKKVDEENKQKEQQEKEAEELNRKREAKNTFLNSFYEKHKILPLDCRYRSLDDLAEENPEFLEYVKNWNIESDFGFCLCGPVGTGKTYALTVVLNHIIKTLAENEKYIQHWPSAYIYWNSASLLLEELKDTFGKDTSLLDKVNGIQNKWFLFIDDFGAHKVSEFAVEKLISILDYRINNKLPTFFSTNCKIDQMKATFGDRVFSRIIACSVMVEVKGKDRRLDIHAQRLKQLKEGTK